MTDTFTLIRGGDEFAAIGAEWDACLETMAGAQPFLGHAWLSAWLAERAPDAALHVLLLRRDGRLRAAAPLCLRRGRYYGVPVRELVWVGDRTSDRLQFLARDDDPEAVRAVWTRLEAEDAGETLLRLEEVPVTSPTATAFAADRPRSAREESSHLPRVAVGDWQALEASLTKKFRSELRTRTKVFDTWGEWRFELETGAAVGAHLERMAALEAASAKGAGGYAFLADPANRSFLAQVIAGGGPATPVLLRLEVGGELVAYLLCFAHGGTLCAYNIAHRPGYEKGSPGKWLIHEAMRWANGQGLAEFDFLRGAHQVKARWRPDETVNCRLVRFRPGPTGTLLHAAVFRLRPWLKSLRATPRGAAEEE